MDIGNIDPITMPFDLVDKGAEKWIRLTWDNIQKVPIFGVRSGLNPLGKKWRESAGVGEFEGQRPQHGLISSTLAPLDPLHGLPLPRTLGVSWPWRSN
jgi:hypothetical protein